MSTEQQAAAAAADPAAADAALQGFLERAGLEASQVDDASLEALRDLLAGGGSNGDSDPQQHHQQQQQQQKEPPSAEDGDDQKVAAAAFPPAAAAHPAKETNGFFQNPPAFFSSSVQQHAVLAVPKNTTDKNEISDADLDNNALPPPPDLDTLTPFERYVVQQLQHQTRMIAELQRRVGNAEQQNGNNNSINYAAPPPQPQQQQPWTRDEQGEAFHRHVARAVPPAQLPQQEPPRGAVPLQRAAPAPVNNNVPQQQQHPAAQPPMTALVTQLRDWLLERPAHFQNSRTAKIWKLYMGLGRRYLEQHPQQIDPFLLLKVLFMLAILTSKMSRRSGGGSSKDGGGGWTTKYYATAAIVVLGFLFQTGYMAFSYNFWIRRDYARRIWAGEDITLDQAVAEEAAVAREPAAAERQEGGWRQTFLFGGRVNAAAAPPQQRSLTSRVLGLLQDILLFFGSFMLSIFPMWRAAPLARPVPAAGGDANNEAAGAGAVDPAGGGPGVVAPPVDPAGPEEEEEEDAPPEERG